MTAPRATCAACGATIALVRASDGAPLPVPVGTRCAGCTPPTQAQLDAVEAWGAEVRARVERERFVAALAGEVTADDAGRAARVALGVHADDPQSVAAWAIRAETYPVTTEGEAMVVLAGCVLAAYLAQLAGVARPSWVAARATWCAEVRATVAAQRVRGDGA